MKDITFNVILNEPNQLIHLDLYKPEQGFMIFAKFSGQEINENKFEISDIEFYVEETNITVRPIHGRSQPRIFHEIDSSTYKYNPIYTNGNNEVMKQIIFNFNKRPTSYEQRSNFDSKFLPLNVMRGEKMDFRITPKNFPKYKEYEDERDGKKNINSHICNIKLYS